MSAVIDLDSRRGHPLPAPVTPLHIEQGDRILRVAAVMDRIGLSRPTIYRRIAAGTFPPAVSLGGKSVGWRASEINTWIAQCDRVGES